MKKTVYMLAICLSMVIVSGCSSNNTTNDVANDSATVTESDNPTNVEDASKNDTAAVVPDQEEETQEVVDPVTAQLSMEEPYNDTRIKVACTGLVQYDELSSDSYCDVPEDGNVFVVLFLNIENYSLTDAYFSAESLQSHVDQADISHTILVNDPEGYPTIFKDIPAGSGINGYIVWEVPKDWTELSLEYTGWAETHSVILNGTFTPADLKEPTPYDQL
ncbi:MAG: DUF4352 domain-containing protein [Eubacterium sp.]|nr:DUF4352 domain-containing protein [Eubacterium sp.]